MSSVVVIMSVSVTVIVSHLGAPTSWLGTANVGSDCSMKLMESKVSRRTDKFFLFKFLTKTWVGALREVHEGSRALRP